MKPTPWPISRNHEAARRHVNQVLRDHGRPYYSRRETEVAQLLDELIRERDEARAAIRMSPCHTQAVEAAVTRYFVWRNHWNGDPESEPFEGSEVEYVTEMFTEMLRAYREGR